MHENRQAADAEILKVATTYTATLFLGRAQYATVRDLKTLAAAIAAAGKLAAKHSNGRPAMVYAIDPMGNSAHVANVPALTEPSKAKAPRKAAKRL